MAAKQPSVRCSLLQVPVQPTQNVMEAGNPPVGAACAREAVRLIGEAYHLGIYPQPFECYKGLFALFDGAAMIVFAVDQQGWRFGIANVGHR